MNRTTRSFSLAAVAAMALSGVAHAQDYPTDRITFVVGFAAGGFADGVTRVIGEHVSRVLGQPVVVENRAGAASNVAARAVASTPADGYTVLIATTAIAANATLYRSLDYSLLDDLVTVAVPVTAPEQFAANPNVASTLEEFIEKARTERLTFGSAGVGSGSHLATSDFFINWTDVDVHHVPYQGGAPAVTDAVGGHVDGLAATSANNIVSQVAEGNLNCLAVAALERYPNLPDCPTFDELGYEGFQAASWIGFFVPAGTPEDVVATLNEAITSALDDPETSQRLEAFGLPLRHEGGAAGAAAFVESEVETWGQRVEAVGAFVD